MTDKEWRRGGAQPRTAIGTETVSQIHSVCQDRKDTCPRCRLMGCQLLGEMTIVSQPLTVYQVCPRVASFGRSLDFQIPVTLLSSFVCRPEYREPSSGSQDILRICAIYLLQYFVRQSETIQAPVVAKHVGFVEVLV